jgi:hypothetical protein
MPCCLRFLCLASALFLPGAGVESPEPRPDQGVAKEAKSKEPDAAAIARLVQQLGSPKFAERQEATKALEAIGFPALDALRKAAKGGDVETARRAGLLVKTIEQGFDSLLADYRGYGLPLPPADAKLVRFESGGRYVLNDKLMPPTYFLGFLLRPGTKKDPPVLLVGTDEVRLEPYQTVEVVQPTPELVKGLDLRWWGRSPFEPNAGLALALQCKARGWDDLAQALWAASLQQSSGHHFGAFYQPSGLPNRTAVAYLAWAYSGNELVKPGTDRDRTAKRIKSLFSEEPRLNTEANRLLLKSLEAALAPSTARPGTAERLIDDLTDVCDAGFRLDEPDSLYARLAHMGFAAVPALLDHLDDDRLTRVVNRGFNNFPPRILRVSDVVSGLLQGLAGDDLGKDWLQRQQGWGVERVSAQAWWDKARKVGEEAYVLAHVLPHGEKAEWPNPLMLGIITKKYPKRLPKLYRTVLDERPKIQIWPVAEAVATSSLPRDTKRELFLHAARHKDLERRREGLWHLQELDPERFLTILLETLDALPKTPTEPYWRCPEAAYAGLVQKTDDPRAWALLEKVARRSDVGLRMEFLNHMSRLEDGDWQRRRVLKFLTAFLDDTDEPDREANPKMFEGPYAGFTFRRLSVRDLAAWQIAFILGMPERPDRDWTPQQWENLRKKVRAALQK